MEFYNGTYSVYIHLFPNGKSYVGITSRPVEIRWVKRELVILNNR